MTSYSTQGRSPRDIAMIDVHFTADHLGKVTRALNNSVRATLDGTAPADRDMLTVTLYTTELMSMDLENAKIQAEDALEPQPEPILNPRRAKTSGGR